MKRLPILIYALIAASSYVLGLLYIFSPTFMPYHAVAVGAEWSAVPEGYRILIGALLDVAGAGWLALAIGLTILTLVPMRRGEAWAHYAALLVTLAHNVPTLGATLTVLSETPASPPWMGPAGTCIAALVAYVIARPWQSREAAECQQGKAGLGTKQSKARCNPLCSAAWNYPQV